MKEKNVRILLRLNQSKCEQGAEKEGMFERVSAPRVNVKLLIEVSFSLFNVAAHGQDSRRKIFIFVKHLKTFVFSLSLCLRNVKDLFDCYSDQTIEDENRRIPLELVIPIGIRYAKRMSHFALIDRYRWSMNARQMRDVRRFFFFSGNRKRKYFVRFLFFSPVSFSLSLSLDRSRFCRSSLWRNLFTLNIFESKMAKIMEQKSQVVLQKERIP